jgi:uncharacterized OB-fold protein
MDFDALDVPGPTTTALTAPFWQAAAKGKLLLQKCEDCGRFIHYPRAICPHCWGATLRWHDAKGSGRLKSFSVVYRAGHPGWQPAAPYVVGLVKLDEGPTMLTLVHGDAVSHSLAVGDAVRLSPISVGGRILPVFSKA